jgi:CxC4 like cysteine cluster associated with KDZ transposases
LEVPFDLEALPAAFMLGPNARCSCGSREINPFNDRSMGIIILYTIAGAVIRDIETIYCNNCRNTRGRVGPDLGEFGIFNWNNRIGFTHELMNHFTIDFTRAGMPIYTFREKIAEIYIGRRSLPFVSYQLFSSAYSCFISLQQLGTNMQCTHCKDNPRIVIVDGVSISFPANGIESLKPPTACDKEKALVRIRSGRNLNSIRSACFGTRLGTRTTNNIRNQFQNALELTDTRGIYPKLRQLLEQHAVASPIHLIIMINNYLGGICNG